MARTAQKVQADSGLLRGGLSAIFTAATVLMAKTPVIIALSTVAAALAIHHYQKPENRSKGVQALLGATLAAPSALALMFYLNATNINNDSLHIPVTPVIREAQEKLPPEIQELMIENLQKSAAEIAEQHLVRWDTAKIEMKRLCTEEPLIAAANGTNCKEAQKYRPRR